MLPADDLPIPCLGSVLFRRLVKAPYQVVGKLRTLGIGASQSFLMKSFRVAVARGPARTSPRTKSRLTRRRTASPT
jgi:hypothetical protein